MATVRPVIQGLEFQQKLGRDLASVAMSPVVRDIVKKQEFFRELTRNVALLNRTSGIQRHFFDVPIKHVPAEG